MFCWGRRRCFHLCNTRDLLKTQIYQVEINDMINKSITKCVRRVIQWGPLLEYMSCKFLRTLLSLLAPLLFRGNNLEQMKSNRMRASFNYTARSPQTRIKLPDWACIFSIWRFELLKYLGRKTKLLDTPFCGIYLCVRKTTIWNSTGTMFAHFWCCRQYHWILCFQ